jgi:hypothetical protein
VGDDRLLASAKRYDLTARVGGDAVSVVGIGAVFTPAAMRGRGHARDLIEQMAGDAAARGCRFALLFSEIGAAYYARQGFHQLPRTLVSLDIARKPGAPAVFMRSGEPADLPAIADIGAGYSSGAAFALDRPVDLIDFAFTRRRALAGLGPPGLRQAEFFVAEEGHRAVAYVFITRGPEGVRLEECGDRDPAGARIGAMLQGLAERTPADTAPIMTGWLPRTLRPPQVRVVGQTPAKEIMMIRPLADAAMPDLAGEIVYWQTDVF